MLQTSLQSSLFSDESHFLTSLENARKDQKPFQHWILSNLFPAQTIQELCNLNLARSPLTYKVGTREENNTYRYYFDLENQAKFSVVQRITDIFHSPRVLDVLTSMCGISFPGHFLRIEYEQDHEGFWLKPHTDIGAKIFTMLIYLNSEPEEGLWGTDLYYDEHTHVKRVPFIQNSSLLFIPSQNTWHGFEPRKMTGVRKALIVNFVKQEWRNRQELASKMPIPKYK